MCGPCPVFARHTLAFALQLSRKHGKTSVYLLTAIGLTPGGSSTVPIYTQTIIEQHSLHKQYIEQHNRHEQYTEQHNRHKQYTEQHNRHKQYTEQHNRHKQYTEQHNSLIRKSADRAQSLRVMPWHSPYNLGKSTEKPQSG